jgi:hypothetical protein
MRVPGDPTSPKRDWRIVSVFLLFVRTGGVLLQAAHSAFTLPILLTIRSDLGRIANESSGAI